VFAKMILAPASSKSSGDTALTDPLVPTGMKTGVSKSPWGVLISPVLALHSLDLCVILNSKFDEAAKRRKSHKK